MTTVLAPILFEEIGSLHPDLPQIIAYSIGKASKEKVIGVLTSYNVVDHHLIGGFIGSKLVSVIGLHVEDDRCIIKHIAVLEEHRNKGIGKQIIRYAAEFFSLQFLTAETDDEARGFYEKCGFSCQSFKGVYGKRYKCSYQRD